MLGTAKLSEREMLFEKIKDEVVILENIKFILEKIHDDRFLWEAEALFSRIINNEVVFTINGGRNRQKSRNCSRLRAPSLAPKSSTKSCRTRTFSRRTSRASASF